jgi:glyoxylase-like metal-dependent hydrolase (beta-lactamase superfamily II)
MNDYRPGWILLGQYPFGDPDGVGSWLIHHGKEAALLELPPDKQLIHDAVKAIADLGVTVKFIFVSHDHEDHFDPVILRSLQRKPAFRAATWIPSKSGHRGITQLDLAGEPLWLVHAPKHSLTDTVTVFRGVAMTGDFELGIIGSVNREVGKKMKRESLAFLAAFERNHGYHIHTLMSAHLNDFRQNFNWPNVVLGEVDTP